MNRLVRWLDGLVERLCNWLNDRVSGKRRLALLGDGLAGVQSGIPLPVDRRIDPGILEMHHNRNEMATKGHLISGSSSVETSCGFWAYCHLTGDLCVWCGGDNALMPGNPHANDFVKAGEDLCPTFAGWGKSHGGSAWFGCCAYPSGEKTVGKMIAFLDCCGDHSWMAPCGGFWKSECKNWPQAKSWCTTVPSTFSSTPGPPQYQTEQYYCTVVIDVQQNQSCN